MRRDFLLAAAILILSQPTYAAAGSTVVIAVGGDSALVPAATMQVLADYVAVPIDIENDSKDLVKRTDEIEKAFRAVTQKLSPLQNLKIKPGVVSLLHWSEAASSFGGSGPHRGSAQLYVFGALKQNTDIFAVSRQIYQAVSAIPLAGGTKITLGDTELGFDEPEKYRSQLLGLIANSVADARKSLGSGGFVEVEGLEHPVSVMQVTDREVLLFIQYRLRVQTKGM